MVQGKGKPLRVAGLSIICLMLAFTWTPAGADHGIEEDEIVVAVLDTGIRATHQEFDYAANGGDGTGPAGQIVAWWDFTGERGLTQFPGAGDTWDSRHEPYDSHGHGTGVASLVAGETLSLAPGAKLAIAKIGMSDGSVINYRQAFDWAINEVEADIVSMSFGLVVPAPDLLIGMEPLFRQAVSKGVVTVTSAGNGMLNSCGPAVTWTHPMGYSNNVLAVGSLHSSGGLNTLVTCSHLDPDVASRGYSVQMAGRAADDRYVTASGTSFAAPLVSGSAVKILEALVADGQPRSFFRVKGLIMDCADQLWPYTVAGFGYFNIGQHRDAVEAASAGTTCSDPPLLSLEGALRLEARLYHDHVVTRGRSLMT